MFTAAGTTGDRRTTPDDSVATVERVVDGDTLDATIAGKSTRVRLLNINTPEVARDGQPGDGQVDALQRLQTRRIGLGQPLDLDRRHRHLSATNRSASEYGGSMAKLKGAGGQLFQSNASVSRWPNR